MSSYISQAFNTWVSGLPTEALIAAVTIGCAVWLLSLAEIVRREYMRGVS